MTIRIGLMAMFAILITSNLLWLVSYRRLEALVQREQQRTERWFNTAEEVAKTPCLEGIRKGFVAASPEVKQ